MYVHNTVVCSSLIQVSLYINQVVRTAEKSITVIMCCITVIMCFYGSLPKLLQQMSLKIDLNKIRTVLKIILSQIHHQSQ